MNAVKTVLVTLLAGVLSIGIAVLGERWLGKSEPRLPSQAAGDGPLYSLPAWELPDLEGRTVSSADWSDKLVVLHYWATWCEPCVEQLALLEESRRQHAEAPVQFVGIAIDRPEDLARFLAEKPIAYPVLLGGVNAISISQRLGNHLQGLPFLVIFDRSGQRVFQRTGPFTGKELAARIERGMTPNRASAEGRPTGRF